MQINVSFDRDETMSKKTDTEPEVSIHVFNYCFNLNKWRHKNKVCKHVKTGAFCGLQKEKPKAKPWQWPCQAKPKAGLLALILALPLLLRLSDQLSILNNNYYLLILIIIMAH